MQISRFIPKYQEAVIALHRKAMVRFNTGISREEEEADLRDIHGVYLCDGEFFVGLLGERLIAMGAFKPKSSHTAELKRIRIDPLEQGKGHGRQLLQALELRAAKQGFSTLCLETARARSLTLAFYDKHQYRRVGEGMYGAVHIVSFAKSLPRTEQEPRQKHEPLSP